MSNVRQCFHWTVLVAHWCLDLFYISSWAPCSFYWKKNSSFDWKFSVPARFFQEEVGFKCILRDFCVKKKKNTCWESRFFIHICFFQVLLLILTYWGSSIRSLKCNVFRRTRSASRLCRLDREPSGHNKNVVDVHSLSSAGCVSWCIEVLDNQSHRHWQIAVLCSPSYWKKPQHKLADRAAQSTVSGMPSGWSSSDYLSGDKSGLAIRKVHHWFKALLVCLQAKKKKKKKMEWQFLLLTFQTRVKFKYMLKNKQEGWLEKIQTKK